MLQQKEKDREMKDDDVIYTWQESQAGFLHKEIEGQDFKANSLSERQAWETNGGNEQEKRKSHTECVIP